MDYDVLVFWLVFQMWFVEFLQNTIQKIPLLNKYTNKTLQKKSRYQNIAKVVTLTAVLFLLITRQL